MISTAHRFSQFTVSIFFMLLIFSGCAHQAKDSSADTAIEPVKQYAEVPSYDEAADALAAELGKQISTVATPDDVEAMQEEAAALAKSLPNPGLKIGEQAPHFTLPNAFGDAVSLYDLLASGPVVLVFYRGHWCPFCNLHLRSLQRIAPTLEDKGAQLVAITPQKPDESLKQVADEGYPFEVLSDLDYSVTAAFDLYFEVSPKLQAVYRKFGIDLEQYNGAGRTALPVPGTFVIDQSGVIRAAQAHTEYKKRMEPAAILMAIDALDPQP